jgi:alginate O-acetyltransferase complex protein AlgI
MLFTQVEFIFYFLPVALAGYFLLARYVPAPGAALLWLAGASLVFYAYWKANFLWVVLISVVVNYGMSFVIESQAQASRRAAALATAVGINLVALAIYKYTNFGIEILNDIAGLHIRAARITLPLGISFFTFTQIAYLADVYGGYNTERNFIKYLLFVTYFPHLVAGPILHHSEMMPQFGAEKSRHFSSNRTAVGLTVFGIGLFKKVVIADGFAHIATPVFQMANKGDVPMMDAWGGALAYSLQIYFDFSGYCDMAIGLSYMFGIVLPFNFNSPYKALSIVEFWRRWHITLSRFLRDYLYFPLGGNRHGGVRRNINLAITMLLGGLWHGAGWTYIIWGGLHGLFLIVNHVWTNVTQRVPALVRLTGTFGYAAFALLLTQLCVVVAWVFFRADNLRAAQRVLGGMIGRGKLPPEDAAAIVMPSHLGLIALGYAICIAMPNVNTMFDAQNIGLTTYKTREAWSLLDIKWSPRPEWAVAAAFILFVGIVVSVIVGEASPFLYFQF